MTESDIPDAATDNHIGCQKCGEEKPLTTYVAEDGDEQADLCDDCHDFFVVGIY